MTALDPDTIADRTMVGVFFRQANRLAGQPLIHHLAGEHWTIQTWDDVRRNVLAIASALVDLGVKAGDHVILISENRHEWVCCDLAIQTAGAITVPIYPNTPPEVAQKIAANCDAVLAIASDAEMASKLPAGGALRRVVTMDSEVATWMTQSPARLDEVARRLAQVDPDGVATVVYTSGTTGDPKGVELSNRGLVDMCRSVLKVFPLSATDSTLSFLPYSHVFERINGTYTGLTFGGQMYISRGADHLAQELNEVQPTVMLSVPRMYEKMHSAVMARVREAPPARRALFDWALGVGGRHSQATRRGPWLRAQHRLADRLVLAPLRRRLVGGRLRFFTSGGAALSREVEAFFWAIGVPILNGWGMTEMSSGACSNTLSNHRFLTVGKPFPGVELKIADDGEILVKSPGNMLGYHKNPEATAETLRDGWIYTGDIGEVDADGYLKITDRKKALFKTAGGKYIAPQPIEFGLLSDPLIERAVIVGESRAYVTALVVPDWAAAQQQGLDEVRLDAHVQMVSTASTPGSAAGRRSSTSLCCGRISPRRGESCRSSSTSSARW
jgi:long-chain acyl-CoA synthetase